MYNFFKKYFNLYIKNKAYKKRNSYSQWGEDKFISKFFENKSFGFYVDIGCFHPIRYSNTCLLFNKGWNGINIDLNPMSIELFNIIRPKDYNLCEAISDEVKELDLYFDHNFSPINTIDKSFYDMVDKKIGFKNLSKKKIKTKTFEEITKDIANLDKINFLNIDCEGHDFNVLNSVNLNKFKPDLICVETHDIHDLSKVSNIQVTKMLEKFDYKIYQRCGPSSLYYK